MKRVHDRREWEIEIESKALKIKKSATGSLIWAILESSINAMKWHNNKTATQWSKMNVYILTHTHTSNGHTHAFYSVKRFDFSEAMARILSFLVSIFIVHPLCMYHSSWAQEAQRVLFLTLSPAYSFVQCVGFFFLFTDNGGYRIFFQRLVLSDRNPLLLCI